VRNNLLSTLHRTLVAFSALALGLGSRSRVLAKYQVTEADLRRHQADWERLQVLRAAGRVGGEQAELRLPRP